MLKSSVLSFDRHQLVEQRLHSITLSLHRGGIGNRHSVDKELDDVARRRFQLADGTLLVGDQPAFDAALAKQMATFNAAQAMRSMRCGGGLANDAFGGRGAAGARL